VDLARRYLAAPGLVGLEIGGSAFNRFEGVRAWNLDYPSGEVFQAAQRSIAGEALPVDLYGVGDRLPLADGSLDFVLTSHVLEHMPDTLRCLREWSRVVKDGGTIFAIVPHRERTMDAGRPRTELEHHLADYALGMDIAGAPLVPTSHYHVWVTEDLVRLIETANRVGLVDWELVEVEDVDSKVGNGFTVVARKRSQPELPRRQAALGPIAFHLWTLDLGFQVTLRTTERAVPGAQPIPPADLPRGPYRVVPVDGGFPPRAGEAQRILVGEQVGPAEIERVELEGTRMRFLGRELHASTWLEADLGDGTLLPYLPEFVDGALEVDTAGFRLPPAEFRIRAVNPQPGGGAGAGYGVREHLG